MSSFTSREKRLTAGISLAVVAAVLVTVLVTVLAAVPIAPSLAQEKIVPPDFSSGNVGWVGLNGNGPFFEPVPGRLPGPVSQDPRYPFVPNGIDGQPTFRIADLNNPN